MTAPPHWSPLAPSLRDRALAVGWTAGDAPLLGDIVAGCAILDSGTGLATSPFGFSAKDLYLGVGGAPTLGLGLDGSMLVLDDATVLGASAGTGGTAIQSLLDDGGHTAEGGYEAASLLAGSGAVAVGLTALGDSMATGEAGVPVE